MRRIRDNYWIEFFIKHGGKRLWREIPMGIASPTKKDVGTHTHTNTYTMHLSEYIVCIIPKRTTPGDAGDLIEFDSRHTRTRILCIYIKVKTRLWRIAN